MKQPSLKINSSSSKSCFILISYHKSYKKVTKRIRQAVKPYASPLRKGHQFSFFSNLNGISGKRQIPLSTYSSVMKNLLICKPVSVRAYGMLQGPSVASTPAPASGAPCSEMLATAVSRDRKTRSFYANVMLCFKLAHTPCFCRESKKY